LPTHIPYVSTRKITFSSQPRHHLNRKTRIFTFVLLFRNPSHHANSPSRSPSFTIPMAPRSGHLPPPSPKQRYRNEFKTRLVAVITLSPTRFPVFQNGASAVFEHRKKNENT